MSDNSGHYELSEKKRHLKTFIKVSVFFGAVLLCFVIMSLFHPINPWLGRDGIQLSRPGLDSAEQGSLDTGSAVPLDPSEPEVTDDIETPPDDHNQAGVWTEEHFMLDEFIEALDDEEIMIWFTITWMSGPDYYKVVLFVRDPENDFWTMEDQSGEREVNLIFSEDGQNLAIQVEGSPQTYYFSADGTGHMTALGAEEQLSWWFITSG